MIRLEDYAKKYKHVRIERRNGILQISFHTDGGTVKWWAGPHEELGYCFSDIGSDPENKVIILTGTGENFIAEIAPLGFSSFSETHMAQHP